MAKQKRYSLEFRERAVRRMKLGDNVSRLARELEAVDYHTRIAFLSGDLLVAYHTKQEGLRWVQ